MQDRMSAAEYRRQFVTPIDEPENPYLKPARVLSKSSDEFLPPTPIKRKHEEDDLTIKVARYLQELKEEKKILLYSHIPQETFTKSWTIKRKNTAMGVRSGVPDMVIVYPKKTVFLELKREKGGVVSSAQQEWLDSLNSTLGVAARVARGWDEAKHCIDSFLTDNS